MSDEPILDPLPEGEALPDSAQTEALLAGDDTPQDAGGDAAPGEEGEEPAGIGIDGEPVAAEEAPPLGEGGADNRRPGPRGREGARPVVEPERRSFGLVRRIQPDAVAWVADFRPLGREVQVRLRSPWQANPGQILEYGLKRAAGGGGRLNGVDTVFNFRPNLEQVLALDEGRGLSPEGLQWVMRAVAREPERIRQVFGPTTSVRLKQQLLEEETFPLPRTLLLAALAIAPLAGRAARRLLAGPLKHPREAALLLAGVPPKGEESLVARVVRDHPDWLLDPLQLPAEGRRERVLRWWKGTGERRWLLQVPAEEIPATAALPLLQAGVFHEDLLPPPEAAAWRRHLDPATRRRLLAAAFQDPARAALPEDPFAGLDGDMRDVLSALAADPRWGDEARSRLLARGELNGAAALDLLRQGAAGEARTRLISLLAALPADGRPVPGPQLALELFAEGAARPDSPAGAALLDWLGGHAAVQAQVEEWLGAPDRREMGLLALGQAGDFSRALVQRLLGMAMSPATRSRLVAAISRHSPERWQERYLLSDEERSAWMEAGAPLA
jgi:hypothetical protein